MTNLSRAPKISSAAAERTLWERGNLGFLYHSGQKKLDDVFRGAPGAVITFNVARQWGKTFFAATKAFEYALKIPKARVRYATAVETDLFEFAFPIFEILMERCPAHLRPKYKSQRKVFRFPNGSEIKLIGLDKKPNGLRGNAIDFIVLDEAGFIRRLDYLHTSVIVPLTTHRPDAKILVISTPPETPDHAFWDFVDRATLEGAYACFTIDDNPMLTPRDIARIEREMGGRGSTAFQREYFCRRIVEASRAIIPEWRGTYEEEPIIDEYYPFYQLQEGLDIGVSQDLTVCIFGHYDFRRAILFIHDEITMNGPDMTTPRLAIQIKSKEWELWGPEKKVDQRWSDNSHPLLNQDLSFLHDITFMPTSKDKLAEMVNQVRMWVAEGRIRVSSKCKHLLGCLSSGIWDIKRKDFYHSKVYGHFDALAALVYLVRNIDENYNPIPLHPFRTWETFVPNPLPLAGTAGILQRALSRKK